MEVTYAMIKPSIVKSNQVGRIIDLIERNGFEIESMKKVQFSKELAETFYQEHASKPFFGGLVAGITSGPVIALALKKDNAVADWRKLIGATNPANAEIGTIRKMYGVSLDENAVHGSDALSTADRELKLVFG